MILLLCVFVACWFLAFKYNIMEVENKIGRFFLTLILAFLGSVIFLLLLTAISLILWNCDVPIYSYKEYKKMELISLQDNSNVSGSFVLGSGNIGESMVYSFYTKDGTYVYQKQIPTYKTRIQFSNETPMCLIYRLKTNDNFWIYSFASSLMEDSKEQYILQIPENSIIKNFNLDAK